MAQRELYLRSKKWIGKNVSFCCLLQPGETNALGNHRYAYNLYTDLVSGNSYSQSNNQLLGDGRLNYEDIFAYSGSVDVDTTSSLSLG